MRRAVLTIVCCAVLATSGCGAAASEAPLATKATRAVTSDRPSTVAGRASTTTTDVADRSNSTRATGHVPPASRSSTLSSAPITSDPPATPATTTTLPTPVTSAPASTTSTTAATPAAPLTHNAVEPSTRPSRPPGPLHVLVAGDSTGAELAVAMADYEATHPGEIHVSHSAFSGCGLTAGDDGRLHAWNLGTEWIDIAGCTSQWNSIPSRVLDESVHVVLVCIGPWDAGLIAFPDGTTSSVLDPQGRKLVADAYASFVAEVRGAGAMPVWVRPATIDVEWERRDDPLDDPKRWDEMRAIVAALDVPEIDLPGFLSATGHDGPVGRPDGIHLAPEVLARFVAEAAVPQVRDLLPA